MPRKAPETGEGLRNRLGIGLSIPPPDIDVGEFPATEGVMRTPSHEADQFDGAAGQRRQLIDSFARTINYLRVSVTDRCDLRCVYCMSEHMTFLPKANLLSLEELDRLCSAFIAKGVRKLRLTGGEPLVRRGVMKLVGSLSRHIASGALDELTVTTNGSQLEKYADELFACGVRRINVSLDTLDPNKFRAITRWGDLNGVLAGIRAAQHVGLAVKINAVALKGVNDNELVRLMEWAHGQAMDITFIEVMPLGDTGENRLDQYLPLSVVRERLDERFTMEEIGYRTRRTRHLRAHPRDRRARRIHHAADAQFLQILQPGARHLHRQAVHVPWARRRRRFAGGHARVGRQ